MPLFIQHSIFPSTVWRECVTRNTTCSFDYDIKWYKRSFLAASQVFLSFLCHSKWKGFVIVHILKRWEEMIPAAEPMQSWLWELRPNIPTPRVWAWAHHSNLEPRQVEVVKLSTSSRLVRDKHKILSPTLKYTTGQCAGWKAWVKMCSEIEPPSSLLSTLTGLGGHYVAFEPKAEFFAFWLMQKFSATCSKHAVIWPRSRIARHSGLYRVSYVILAEKVLH